MFRFKVILFLFFFVLLLFVFESESYIGIVDLDIYCIVINFVNECVKWKYLKLVVLN